ncbi:phospholipid scramblase 1 isoform X1 [Uranotaenia lowii]|uniref:phospholipid scramblase 1 isoform X1 n=2 Tax=Uranotaenia lowii TaxID=190385 RepID=UPI002478390F|nr:phospholipid scramblase 1 isoform X1 [Uranotaenia lowii]XP_055607417.1 phospholipid scramblase 1 isoform X1 [Uranotaenia lowii]XP_055607418.1 phospholipid scramblase 1 isoform X1 [Uranotaenia lowii]
MMNLQSQTYAPAQPYGAYPPGPVTVQPGMPGAPPQTAPGLAGAGGWMTIPQGIPNCPPGLEYLTSIDQLLVKQKVELLEAFTGFETANKYTVKNTLGQKVYWAAEDTDCCTRNCCGPARPFDMKILDFYQNEVMHLNRPLRCQSCCFPCCLQTLEVSAPPGNVIGTVEQDWSIFTPQFSLKDTAGNTVLKIEGPCCTFSICGDVEFKVVTTNGDQVGKISKQWSGLAREAFTDADHFGINFPMDLDVRMKATLLGALFLIDYMFFEKSGNNERDRPGMF